VEKIVYWTGTTEAVAIYPDDYDSDAEADAAAPAPEPNQFANAGQTSIAQLLSYPETRLTSKIRAKNVQQEGP
jgi:hypothetical protein